MRLLILLLLVIFVGYNVYSYINSIKVYKSSEKDSNDDAINVEYEEID